MQQLLIWSIISILLATVGSLVAFSRAFGKRKEIMSELPAYETFEEEEDEDDEFEGSFSGMSFVMSTLPITGIIYTALVFMLIMIFSPETKVQETVAIGAMLAVGLSCLFGNLGRSLFYDEAMDGLNDKEEGDLRFSGRYMVFLVLPETALIYGLQVSVLGLVFSGILGGTEATFGIGSAKSYLYGAVILGLSASATLGMGHMFDKTNSLYKDEEYFGKKMMYTVMPHFINIVGLIAAIFLMVFSSMMG